MPTSSSRTMIGRYSSRSSTESKTRLRQVLAYLNEIIDTVRTGRQQGKTIADLQETITPDRLRTIANTDYGTFVEASLAKHTLIAPGSPARDGIGNSVRTNIANIYNALGSTAPKAARNLFSPS